MKPYFSLFRVLVPSWRFFDDFGQGYSPQFRFGKNIHEPVEWLPLLINEQRKPHHLFFNPRGNVRLLTASAFERLILEAQDFIDTPDTFLNTATYQVCEQLVRERVPQEASFFQFKMVGMDSEDVFVSKVIDI